MIEIHPLTAIGEIAADDDLGAIIAGAEGAGIKSRAFFFATTSHDTTVCLSSEFSILAKHCPVL